MKGRRILRPNLLGATGRYSDQEASMKGRRILRPNHALDAPAAGEPAASMKGRRILRPNPEAWSVMTGSGTLQ